MKSTFSYSVAAVFLFGAGWIGSWIYQKEFAKDPGPEIQTEIDQSPMIVGLELPIRSKDGRSGNAVLKAAYADQISEKEIRVYGGFEYRTPDKVITGEEAIINLVTGTTRQMKGIKIWEK